MAWLAEVIFFGAYAIGYFLNLTLPKNVWDLLTAIAAAVIAVLLVVDNHATWYHRPPNA